MDSSAKRNSLFVNTLFFILGFSVIFALLGVLIQTVFAHSAISRMWIAWIAGSIIIFFGLLMLDLIPIPTLLSTHRFMPKKGKSAYLASFIFGASFAVGWTPCVSAALGAILALAVSSPSTSFILLVAYSIGIGAPFLLFSLFLDRAQSALRKWSKLAFSLRTVFAILIIILGILIFTQRLSDVANIPLVVNGLSSLGLGTSSGSSIDSLTIVNIFIAMLAGLFSFASPCILPLVPTFLSYLASLTVQNETK